MTTDDPFLKLLCSDELPFEGDAAGGEYFGGHGHRQRSVAITGSSGGRIQRP
jgi:hypothetical protein